MAEDICEEDLLEDIAAFEQLDFNDIPTQTPSILEAPEFELKPLPSHLKYAYLMEGEKLPVTISSNLSSEQEDRLVDLLKDHKKTFGWTIADIRGISPSLCHNLLRSKAFVVFWDMRVFTDGLLRIFLKLQNPYVTCCMLTKLLNSPPIVKRLLKQSRMLLSRHPLSLLQIGPYLLR